MLTLAYASRPPGVKREPSAILGLTRSGKERQDECILQTLLIKGGKSSSELCHQARRPAGLTSQ